MLVAEDAPPPVADVRARPSTATPAERLLTPAQAAELLGRHPATVRRWADSGRLTTVRTTGGHRRFLADEVHRLLAGDLPAERDPEGDAGPDRPDVPGSDVVDALLTPAEVAAILAVDATTVRRWADSGRLPSVRTVGGHRRFPASRVEVAATELRRRRQVLAAVHAGLGAPAP